MFTKLYALLQVQSPPQKVSWVVWAGAGFVLLVGVSLVIYFFIRLRKVDKEVEEDWSLSQGTLLGVVHPPDQVETRSRDAGQPQAPTRPARVEPTISEQPDSAFIESEPVAPVADVGSAGSPQRHEREATHRQLTQEPSPLVQETIPPEPLTKEGEEEPEFAVLSDEIWSELEQGKDTAQAGSTDRPPQAARVEQASRRELFEPPRVEPIVPPRRPFEPPSIEPIIPRPAPVSPVAKPPASQSGAGAQLSRTSPGRQQTVAGSVLGLPARISREPSILDRSSSRATGNPSARAEREVIRTLSTYGKNVGDDEKGHWGTVLLVLAIALVGSSVLSYLYVPSVHSWVDNIRMRVRQTAPEPPPVDKTTAKVRIFPQRPEVVNNQVKVRGQVYNISDEALPALAMEVLLMRSDGGPPQPRAVQIKPEELPPNQPGHLSVGTFEFNYDGKQFSSFTITRFLSNGVEIKFSMPNQSK